MYYSLTLVHIRIINGTNCMGLAECFFLTAWGVTGSLLQWSFLNVADNYQQHAYSRWLTQCVLRHFYADVPKMNFDSKHKLTSSTLKLIAGLQQITQLNLTNNPIKSLLIKNCFSYCLFVSYSMSNQDAGSDCFQKINSILLKWHYFQCFYNFNTFWISKSQKLNTTLLYENKQMLRRNS